MIKRLKAPPLPCQSVGRNWKKAPNVSYEHSPQSGDLALLGATALIDFVQGSCQPDSEAMDGLCQ